jgi:hypothetical protein
MVDDSVRLKYREGKVLVEKRNGFFEFKDENEVARDFNYVRTEITEWAKDENGIARECGTGLYRYDKRK